MRTSDSRGVGRAFEKKAKNTKKKYRDYIIFVLASSWLACYTAASDDHRAGFSFRIMTRTLVP